ncbi:DUF2147 domain-containing protein [Gillisia sp. M10.2A]|uniref:DUF2147 domain-containing protein n=1 Tax=Gillisia lutea TaxID=2909668 RepID=A0ABS9EMV1_9FLAO|nr:DUF2147 domain-containing protein [Gillisia lutea]MCF4102781.1 DUF2147 domain-containing protein [Gillisia lutea]
MKAKKPILYFLMILFISLNTQAQSVIGEWRTINEETGKANSIIKIYEDNGEICGKVVRILKEEDRDRRCTKCEGDLKDKPIEGLVVMRGLEKDGQEYVNGEVTDPKSGKVYKCKIWLNENNPDILNIRGYIAFFYRTQTWERAK